MSVPTVRLTNGRQVKLGRIPLRNTFDVGRVRFVVTGDGRLKAVPLLHAYYDPAKDHAPPPDQVDWTPKALASLKRVYLNDQEGDCVIASKYHTIGVWTGNESGTPVQVPDSDVQQAYRTICGPGDNGCVITDVLDYWKSPGLPANGGVNKLDDYIALDWTNKQMVQVALDLFGSITLGINLPGDWTCTDCVWGPSGGNVGGHDVPALGYGAHLTDSTGKPFGQDGVVISTWGGLCLIPWAQFCSREFIEEAYVHLGPDWYARGSLAPNGIDVATLRQDLALIAQGQVPPLGPPAPPFPPFPPIPPVPPTANVLQIVSDLPPGSYPLLPPGGVGLSAQLAQELRGALTGVRLMAAPPWLAQVCQLVESGALNAFLGPALLTLARLVCGFVPLTKGGCGCK